MHELKCVENWEGLELALGETQKVEGSFKRGGGSADNGCTVTSILLGGVRRIFHQQPG